MLETERLILRPWRESDAPTLFRWASDPRVGPAADWRVHASVEYSREIIRTVFSAPETYAIEFKGADEIDLHDIEKAERAGRLADGSGTGNAPRRRTLLDRLTDRFADKPDASAPLNPVGSIGLIPPGKGNCLMGPNDREIGCWVAAPFWGRGIAPEATREIIRHGFCDLGLSALWVCSFVENAKSARAQEKNGFRLVRVEEAKNHVTGAVRTQQVSVLTREEWSARQA